MFFRLRPEKLELVLLRYLNARMTFSSSESLSFSNIEKGYEGELRSDVWLRGLTDEWLILNDLLLEYNGSRFQIDTLIIADEKIYLLDVKYFEGDYSINDDKWYNPADILQKNPLHQLERCETLLKKLLHKLGYHYLIDSYLIFNNPEFHLYTTSINPAIIFPTQLNRFLKKLNTRPVKLNKKHFQLAHQLNARHIVESPYTRLPCYTYEHLKKGIPCPNCKTFFSDESFVCKKCGCIEETEEAILRCVNEFSLLFPDRKITTDSIHVWCSIIKSKKTIRRILAKNFELIRHSRSSYYILKE
ncbi:nuclease-related domain-containing protein [Bacillus sp. OK048]|uniref:nuclease-related domain-containing protein n=1 Tax=Bacillus sp. OK048 TaxID=1882761 RepID=UPI0008868469|nr:nuclease-related domain-containing protein [Bacillus sp. OK048]SDM97893.1 Nuclease-related domain-containing protein [Bacillus sp. OK048]